MLSKVKKEDIKCRFCNAPDNDGHLFWDCTFLPFVELRNNPEFLPLMNRDRTHWPRCFLWRGSPWAVASSDLASHNLEKALGPYPLSTHSTWHLFGVRMMPKIWLMMSLSVLIFGQMVVGNLSLILMLRLRGLERLFFDSNHWGYAQDLDDPQEGSSHIFSGSLAQYSRFKGLSIGSVVLALQA